MIPPLAQTQQTSEPDGRIHRFFLRWLQDLRRLALVPREIEVDLGSTAATRGSFTLTDGEIGAASKVAIWQAPGPYTGKGTRADEAEMDRIDAFAEPGAGQATVRWRVSNGHVAMRDVSGESGDGSVSAIGQHVAVKRMFAQRIGKVRGNVKFFYAVSG